MLGYDNIADLRKHYHNDLLDCVRSSPLGISFDVEYREKMVVSAKEIQKAISGLVILLLVVDNSFTEHPVLASTKIIPMFSVWQNSCSIDRIPVPLRFAWQYDFCHIGANY